MTAWSRFFHSDRWIPWCFVAFFVVVLGVNGAMFGLAVDSWTGLAVDQAYRNGLAFNAQLDAKRMQQELGWRVALDVAQVVDSSVEVTVRVRDRNGRDISDARVEAMLLRPTQAGADVILPLPPRGQGLYGATIELPLLGQWDLRLDVIKDGRRHRSTRRLRLS